MEKRWDTSTLSLHPIIATVKLARLICRLWHVRLPCRKRLWNRFSIWIVDMRHNMQPENSKQDSTIGSLATRSWNIATPIMIHGLWNGPKNIEKHLWTSSNIAKIHQQIPQNPQISSDLPLLSPLETHPKNSRHPHLAPSPCDAMTEIMSQESAVALVGPMLLSSG